jgi:hypothetical protein
VAGGLATGASARIQKAFHASDDFNPPSVDSTVLAALSYHPSSLSPSCAIGARPRPEAKLLRRSLSWAHLSEVILSTSNRRYEACFFRISCSPLCIFNCTTPATTDVQLCNQVLSFPDCEIGLPLQHATHYRKQPLRSLTKLLYAVWTVQNGVLYGNQEDQGQEPRGGT